MSNQERVNVVVAGGDMQRGIIDGLGDDLVIRMCLAGQGQWVKLEQIPLDFRHSLRA